MGAGDAAPTWHYGLVARWWAEFERDGPEIDYFQSLIRAHGEPALDAGCGTGRLLVPALRAGLDVDGVDVSPDMLDHCRRIAGEAGVSAPRLYAQPLHALDLPRRYRTIFVCGALGIGGGRRELIASLERMHRHLEPGGALVVDEVAGLTADGWARHVERLGPLPQAWSEPGPPRVAADGTRFDLSMRILEVDLANRERVQEIRVRASGPGGDREEVRALRLAIAFEDDLTAALRAAGFARAEGGEGYAVGGRTARVVTAWA